MNEFYSGDCLELLDRIKDNSIDYINVDPPYFIKYDDWDNQWKSDDEYLEWCRLWTGECERILKPNRMLTVWGTLKTDLFLRYKLEVLNSTSLFPQHEIIWSYNWGGRGKSNFARKHEYAWNYSKLKKFLFNDNDIRVERKTKNNLRTGKAYTIGTIPTCVWEKNNHTSSKEHCSWHSTSKNIFILQRMIRAYTNIGDTVLDFFGGSGSTAIACKREGRNFIYNDVSDKYLELAKERIEILG